VFNKPRDKPPPRHDLIPRRNIQSYRADKYIKCTRRKNGRGNAANEVDIISPGRGLRWCAVRSGGKPLADCDRASNGVLIVRNDRIAEQEFDFLFRALHDPNTEE
jgi:hypothetical protein